MKRKHILWCAIFVLTAAIIFFPVMKTCHISGNGIILTTDKEKIGECRITVEIYELTSLAVSYRKTFSFAIDDEELSEFDTANDTDTGDGLCLISQMYYDAQKDQMAGCSLIYQEDLSYAAICWNDKLYFIPNGTEMPYSEIPFSN